MARRLGGVDDTARVVMFRRTNDRAFTQYEITPNTPLSEVAHPSGLSVPGEDRAKLPTFLYLWQPEPLLEKIGPM
jgi:protease-4